MQRFNERVDLRLKKGKALAVILGIMFVLVTHGACSRTASPTIQHPSASAASASSHEVTVATTAASEITEDWRLDTSPCTITWFVDSDWYQKKWDVSTNVYDKMVTDATGITINISSGNDDKLSAIIASGEFPDVISAPYKYSQVQMLQKSGNVWALDELITKYAPHMKLFDSMVKWHSQADGHIYGYVNYFYAPEELKADKGVTYVEMMARKDIMDQCGITAADFTTKQGTINALRKVKDAGIKYNGFDVIPAYFDLTNIQQFFGAPREDKDGNLLNRDYQPETLEALKFLNLMYREGLLAKDNFTLYPDQKKDKIAQGSVFAFTDHIIDQRVPELYDNDNNALFVGVGPFKGDEGKAWHFDSAGMLGWTSSMITKNAKNPARIIRLFEYMTWNDEVQLNSYYGPQGIVWQYNGKKQVVLTDSYMTDKMDNSVKADLKYNPNFIWLLNWVPMMHHPLATDNPQENALYQCDTDYAKYVYNDTAFSIANPDAGTDEAAIYTRINDYHQQQFALIVAYAQSDADVERMFQDMIYHEKNLGYDTLYKWQNDQFEAAKQKLGIQYAWPDNIK